MTTATGKHSPAYLDLQARLQQLENDNRQLVATNETLVCDLTRTILSASEYSMRAAVAEEENGRLKQRVKELSDKVIRGAAEQQRLRQAVINARPRIREVPTDLVRPYSPVVQLPYTSPVPYRDTSSEQTQELPLLDQPAIWPVYPTPAA